MEVMIPSRVWVQISPMLCWNRRRYFDSLRVKASLAALSSDTSWTAPISRVPRLSWTRWPTT